MNIHRQNNLKYWIFVTAYIPAQKAAAKKSCKNANYAEVKKYNHQHDLQSAV